MPLAVGHYVVATNVMFIGERPFRNALVVKAIGKKVKVARSNAPGEKERFMLLNRIEILGYYEDKAEADRAAETAYSIWQSYQTKIKALEDECRAAVRHAGKTGESMS